MSEIRPASLSQIKQVIENIEHTDICYQVRNHQELVDVVELLKNDAMTTSDPFNEVTVEGKSVDDTWNIDTAKPTINDQLIFLNEIAQCIMKNSSVSSITLTNDNGRYFSFERKLKTSEKLSRLFG
ncbi:hypothetical protein ABTQ33_04765 [Paucilactobacillus suebicus]|uniref:Uncharacterized protein n=1 Tax=Paucilactobacillus suebicus DSM 5007 = KCTC 3549 TaxID=1423807 RepID=A0A0R1W339_9LACO|nr:hypothetical protein [Paucilactobacillus suebicus]KRM12257.1 hypothetical protein FD16_GL002442 [Paucilactobacillus suebicus DSM 5007 = KCTC 3549]